METTREQVENHYGRGEILNSILRALREMGKDVAQLVPADLALVDEFHIRGREATVELARRASLKPGLRVLDVGCGLGGSARYLAAEHRCRVTGIDLTKEYVDVANALAALVGLKEMVEFHHGSALDIPFDDGSCDVVWTEHAQMNIADKRAFYAEIARVLAPHGRLLFHDIFQGNRGTAALSRAVGRRRLNQLSRHARGGAANPRGVGLLDPRLGGQKPAIAGVVHWGHREAQAVGPAAARPALADGR